MLREQYRISEGESGSFVLSPVTADAGFKELTVFFDGDALHRMVIHDNLNQRVEVTLSELNSSPALTPEDFSFVPPPGADLFYYDE